jgi:hypothetical protein
MKQYTIVSSYSTRKSSKTGTIAELTEYFSYTLLVGESWQNARGNKKINKNPKNIKSLVTNLNNAVTNSAANGNPSVFYYLEN